MTAAAWGGAFPNDWQRVRLRNLVASVKSGVWGDEPSDENGAVCVRAADFDRARLRVSLEKAPLRAIPPEQLRSCALALGDLILEKSGGGDQQPVGAVVMFDHLVPAVPTNFAARIRPAPDVEARFLCYVFAATYALRLNVRSIKQTTGLQNLDVGSFLAEEWAVPSFDEQSRISDFLDREIARMDALLRAREQLDELLSERFRADAARRLLRQVDPTTDRAAELPSGWRSARLATVVKLQRGHDLPDQARRYGDVPIVSSGGITGYHDEPIKLGPGVVTGRYGTVGEVFWLEGPYWPLNTSLYVADFRGNDPRWVYHLLRVLPLNVDAEKSAVTGINRNVVGELRVPLPPPEEQRRLARSLDDTEQDVTVARAATRKHLQLLKERRQALITAAVTGVDLPNQAA